jgi:hypothetical protein
MESDGNFLPSIRIGIGRNRTGDDLSRCSDIETILAALEPQRLLPPIVNEDAAAAHNRVLASLCQQGLPQLQPEDIRCTPVVHRDLLK